MDDISLRNHVDSLRFHEDMDRTKLFIKMLILFEKHATAIYSANGNNLPLRPHSTLSLVPRYHLEYY